MSMNTAGIEAINTLPEYILCYVCLLIIIALVVAGFLTMLNKIPLCLLANHYWIRENGVFRCMRCGKTR